jgi:putative acyl-CoA dehydrogenase
MNLHQFAETHEVTNQPPSLDGANLYRLDLPLQEWSRRFGAGWAESRIDAYGALAGGPLMAAGFLANAHKPEFSSHDRYGHRIDLVEFHPAYHELMRTAVEHGLPRCPGPIRARRPCCPAAMTYLHSQAEAGTGCPLTMTFAACRRCACSRIWPATGCRKSSPRIRPAQRRRPAQGRGHHRHGHDREAGRHRCARQHHPRLSGRCPGPGQAYELVGHKWFCSAPMCDAFLTLAQTDKGLSCFLLPRHRPDDTRNQFYIQRLKNKLGNCSNASSEVEFRGALAWMVGEEGRGVPTIIEMVAMTRFDCMVGSSALMRQALTQAAITARTARSAGGCSASSR